MTFRYAFPMEKFKSLRVYQKAPELVIKTYEITKNFPAEEKFNLISQMRRASVSVTANIVEGTKRKTIADRMQFHRIADTSLEELKYYYILSNDLRYINTQELENLLNHSREVGRMLHALTKKL